MIRASAYQVIGFVTRMVIAPTEAMNLCVALTHSLIVQMEDVSDGIHGVMETMTAETTAMRIDVQVED